MKRLGIILFLLVSPASNALAQFGNSETIVVLADASIALPMMELARTYTRLRGAVVNLTFGESDAQIDQIENGLACDLFIGMSPASFARLRTQGLTDIYSQRPLARNMLAFTGAKDARLSAAMKEHGRFAEMLVRMTPGLTILLPPPSRPERLAVIEAIGRMELALPLGMYLKDSRDERGWPLQALKSNVYSFILFTDALRAQERGTLSLLETVPMEYHRPLKYEGIVVGGEHMTASRKFLDFLTTKQAKAVFRKYGFVD